MPAGVIWIDPSRGTGTTAGWSTSGTVTYDATKDAIKLDATGSNTPANISKSFIINAAGGYLVEDIEFAGTLPAAGTIFTIFYDAAFANFSYYLRVQAGGAINLNDGTASATGVLVADTKHRIELAWTITNTTTNQIKVWVDGALIFDTSNLTLTSASTVLVQMGLCTAPGASQVAYWSNIYTDADTSLTRLYPDLWLEPRRPAGLGTNEFDTGIGSGTNRWDRVAEKPISETNGWREATPAAPSTERMPPDAVLASSALTGATVANLDDDPDAGGTDFATATSNNTAVSVRVSFATPSITPAGTQEFRAQVKKNAASGTGTPTAQIDLYENGVLISAGTPASVTSTTGQVISRTWDMTGRTASQIEALVSGTASGGSPGARASVDIGAIEWNAAAPAVAAKETYALQGVGTGGVDLTGKTLIARMAWVWAKASAAGTAYLIDNGTETAISLTTTSALYARITDTATYPAGTDQIGLRALAGTDDTDLYECGAVIAALVPAGPATYTGSGTPSLAAITAAGSGSHTAPTYSGSGATTVAAVTASGTGSNAVEYVGSGAPALAAATASGAGSHTAPTYTGTGTPSLAAATAAGTGLHTAPTYSGSGAASVAAVGGAGTGSHTAPVYSGAGAATLAALSAAGTGSHTAPTYAGAGAATIAASTASASGTHAGPTYAGSGSDTLAAVTATGAGLFSAVEYVGTSAATLAAVTAAGSGAYDAGTFTATGAATLAAVTSAGTGSHTTPTYTGLAAASLAAVQAAAAGAHTPPVYTGAGAVMLGTLTAAGAGTFAPTFIGTGAVSVAAITAVGVGAFSEEIYTPRPEGTISIALGPGATLAAVQGPDSMVTAHSPPEAVIVAGVSPGASISAQTPGASIGSAGGPGATLVAVIPPGATMAEAIS